MPQRRDHRGRQHHRARHHGQCAAQVADRSFRVQPARRAQRGPALVGIHRRTFRRAYAGNRDVQDAEPERHFRAALGAGNRGDQHAQQGQSPRGIVHPSGRRQRRGPTRLGRGQFGRRRIRGHAGFLIMSQSRAMAEWIGFKTIIIREFSRIVRIWGQTLVPPAVTATLYFIIFGSLIGRRVGQVGGFDYMQFIAPGLIMMTVITNSYGNVVSSFFGAKFGKHLEELLVSPLPNWLILSGYVAGGIVRGLAVGSVVTVVALFFTRLSVQHVFAIISAVLLTSVVFSLGGFINALFAKNFDHISWFPTFVLTPLTYLGGVFYSVTMLPPWARLVTHLNPILYMVSAFRYGFLGESDVDLRLAYGIMTGAALLMFALAAALLNRGAGIRE